VPENDSPGEHRHIHLSMKEAKAFDVWTRGGVYVENRQVGRKK
jgi:hypothetical protein